MSDLLIATKLVRNESHRGERFAILEGENHQFYAVRSAVPYFCFEGDTVGEVKATAVRALEFYYDKHIRAVEQIRTTHD